MRRFAFLVALALTALHAVAATPDYARESRWADEVLPQIVVGDPVWLAVPGKPRVLAIFNPPAGTAKGAIVVVHGLGVHPDWNLIGELRTKLADRGYATLAVQMPVLAADAPRDSYRALFEDASARIQAAFEWLRGKGYSSAAIVSHSLGASMAEAFLAHGGTAIAWAPVGMQDDLSVRPRMPVLDVVAERDLPEVLAAARVRAARLPGDGCSRAVTIPETDHFMNGATSALSDAIATFLDRVYARRC
jgi:alpha/beta superfamily hydrolase